MKINIKNFINDGNYCKEISDYHLDEWHIKNLKLSIHISNLNTKELLLSGNLSYQVNRICDRCACSFCSCVSIPVYEIYTADTTDLENENRIINHSIDLNDLLRNLIVLQLSLPSLCQEDCKGICAECGADLNAVICGCASPHVL